jgi:O-antigen ligase
LILLVGFPLLPNDVKGRFLTLFAPKDSGELTNAEKVAAASAEGRLQGLIDGFRIANQAPFWGVGPNCSAEAAFDMRVEEGIESGNYVLQLHNLYGQVVAELGYPGFLIWVGIYLNSVVSIYRANASKKHLNDVESEQFKWTGQLLLGWLVVLAVYGMAGHTLYDYKWLVTFAIINAWLAISQSSDKTIPEDEVVAVA